MALCNTPRIVLAAPGSGSGKTTIMCALLAVLRSRKYKVAAFKSGPDYIDPMFHSQVIGTPSRNLDMFLFGGGTAGAAMARYLLAADSAAADIAVLEGAMGFYDGLGTTSDDSAYDLARATRTPVIAIVDGNGAAISLAAQIRGLADFRADSHIAGFIVNHVRPAVYAYYKEVWEKETGLPALGYMPYVPAGTLPSRHLGLITAGEIDDLQGRVQALAAQAAQSLDIDRIMALARQARPFTYEDQVPGFVGKVCLAVARDAAFCFYYEDSLRLLEQLGAEIIYFSPLQDTKLPACDGIYLGGGYPELYASQLESNLSMRGSLWRALQQNIPCLAECGGFMYLMKQFRDGDKTYDWVGAIDGTTYMTQQLTRFGYITVTAKEDTLFCRAGETYTAHEFHYSDSTCNGISCDARKAAGRRRWDCMYSRGQLFAGYPHMHLWGNIQGARRFITACQRYSQRRSV
ncbi:MAG: cobyrinate a,c-diamide synthase [Megasphaera sp.]|jgi:cobyrinic acid a,c-diamide synthase|nr:cobyrinate a,c-diamide synthase [Megasphaera sp.]